MNYKFKLGFIKFGDNKNNVVQNNFSNGNAWFVSKIIPTNSPIDEINQLKLIDTKNEAVIDINKFNLKNKSYSYSKNGSINLVEYSPKKIVYKVSNSESSFIVFSEIFYSKGWKIFVDDIEKDLVRVNYVLRGIELEGENQKIEMIFDPSSYKFGNIIIIISSTILLLLIIIISINEIKTLIKKRWKIYI